MASKRYLPLITWKPKEENGLHVPPSLKSSPSDIKHDRFCIPLERLQLPNACQRFRLLRICRHPYQLHPDRLILPSIPHRLRKHNARLRTQNSRGGLELAQMHLVQEARLQGHLHPVCTG